MLRLGAGGMDWWEFTVGLAIMLMAIFLRYFMGLRTAWEIVMFWGYWVVGLALMGNARGKRKRGPGFDPSSHKMVNTLHRLSGSSRSGGRSFWPFIFFSLFCIVFFGYRATIEKGLASRQKTSFGTISQCEERGRGNENYCDYTFSVANEQYTGGSKAERGIDFGQTVTVYYDGQNPQVSALEDFSEQSRHDLRFAYILGSVLVAVVALVLWAKAPSGEASDKKTS
jgi:hypothetical protein